MEDAVMEGQKVDLGHDCDSLTSSSSSRDNRWRRRVMKTREMTEDEMMQLALRLSKQEASQEEDDVRKAIHQSRTEGDLSHSNQDFTSATFSSSDCSQDSPSHRPMSPTFPRTPSKASTGHMTPARVKLTSADQREPSEPESQTQDDRGEDVTSGRSYDLILDGSDEDDYTADPLSPVFNHETCAPPAGNTAPPIRSTGRSRVQLDEEGRAADLQTVKYYWGVPFCPRGLSPDRYTQVIVSQLDTYSRTLKEARRLLWRKAKWRKAITPDTNVSSPEPRQTDADSVVETPEGLDHDLQDMDVDVCPETQLSERDKKDVEDDEDDEGPRLEGDAVKSPAGASPDVFESEVLDSAALEQEHEATEDRKSLSEVEEICDQENEASEGSDVECPLCHVSFLLADVEMHAAFCEGDKRSRARPRKRRRREAARESVQEKCYICQTMVSVSNYSHHTRLCVQLSVKPAKGNLLSALEQSEAAQLGTGSKSYMSECAAHCSSTVKPGSSGSRVQPSLLGVGLNEIIELEDDDDDDDDDEDSSVRMSSGVSAATDLLDRGSRRSQKPKR